jgi:predicted CopG family antitoxin
MPRGTKTVIEELDFTQLNNMVASLKAESESTSEFTVEFIECLQKRYNLDTAVFKDIEIEDVPDEIIKILQSGNVPTKEELLPLDSDGQNYLMMELVWLCGMQRIAYYSEDEELEEGEPSTFDRILVMRDVSPAHWIGGYLIAALTLLFAKVPSEDFIDSLTNNFEDSHENVMKISNSFVEACSSIFHRYEEDSCFYDLKPEEDDE